MGNVFFYHIVLVAAVHTHVHHVVWFDVVEGKLEGHSRIDAPRSHDLIGDAGLIQALDAFHSRKDVSQLESKPSTTVQTAAVEEADYVEIHDAHTVDPVVDFRLVPGDSHGDAARLPVLYIFADRSLVLRLVEIIHVTAMQVSGFAADLDCLVNGGLHIREAVAVKLANPLQRPAFGQVLSRGLDHVRGLVIGDHGVDAADQALAHVSLILSGV